VEVEQEVMEEAEEEQEVIVHLFQVGQKLHYQDLEELIFQLQLEQEEQMEVLQYLVDHKEEFKDQIQFFQQLQVQVAVVELLEQVMV
jgi:hypothetical protein